MAALVANPEAARMAEDLTRYVATAPRLADYRRRWPNGPGPAARDQGDALAVLLYDARASRWLQEIGKRLAGRGPPRQRPPRT